MPHTNNPCRVMLLLRIRGVRVPVLRCAIPTAVIVPPLTAVRTRRADQSQDDGKGDSRLSAKTESSSREMDNREPRSRESKYVLVHTEPVDRG